MLNEYENDWDLKGHKHKLESKDSWKACLTLWLVDSGMKCKQISISTALPLVKCYSNPKSLPGDLLLLTSMIRLS